MYNKSILDNNGAANAFSIIHVLVNIFLLTKALLGSLIVSCSVVRSILSGFLFFHVH